MGNLGRFNEKIAAGDTALGANINLIDPAVTELLGDVGYDFLWVDLEHTPLTNERVFQHLIAARGTGAAVFVRIPWNDPILAKPILEMGPDGIIFPNIRTAEEARLAIRSVTYPPGGIRGFGPMRAIRYGLDDVLEYVGEASSRLWKIIQIEHSQAVENLDEILDVEGIDSIVVGPCDLSGSIGLLGQTDHREVKKLIDTISGKARERNIPFGAGIGYNPATFREWMQRGVNWIALENDYGFLRRAAVQVYREAGELARGKA
jgi:2-keto-3-deoxy-L-rhamnonate aldolase RhmA